MKADIAVFRDTDGRAYVRPGFFIVEFKNKNNKLTIRNDAEQEIRIEIQHDAGKLVEYIGTKAAGPHKATLSVNGMTQNGSSVIHYHVFLGAEEALGNSPPTLIIDD